MAKKTLSFIEKGPNPVVIQWVEDLLAEAKSGELQELVYVASYRGNLVNSASTNLNENRMRVIGELEQIKFHLLAREL